jgi:MoxR-like ATPase
MTEPVSLNFLNLFRRLDMNTLTRSDHNGNATSLEHALMDMPLREEVATAYDQISQVIIGKSKTIKLALCCLLSNGHLLLEDKPGSGKTVFAAALAKAFGVEYNRVQFTNDLLPSDLLGCSIYDRENGQFRFQKGPIFTQLLFADEINRAAPKTQSALLEVMEERQVSIDGTTFAIGQPFWVIATQNPLEHSGTSALPDAQLDRFMMRLSLGYPSREAELEILKGADKRSLIEQQTGCFRREHLLEYCQVPQSISVTDATYTYLQNLVEFTRHSDLFVNGLSTRAAQSLLKAAKTWAWMHNDTAVLPSYIQAVFVPVVGHRLGDIVAAESVLEQVGIPR